MDRGWTWIWIESDQMNLRGIKWIKNPVFRFSYLISTNFGNSYIDLPAIERFFCSRSSKSVLQMWRMLLIIMCFCGCFVIICIIEND